MDGIFNSGAQKKNQKSRKKNAPRAVQRQKKKAKKQEDKMIQLKHLHGPGKPLTKKKLKAYKKRKLMEIKANQSSDDADSDNDHFGRHHANKKMRSNNNPRGETERKGADNGDRSDDDNNEHVGPTEGLKAMTQRGQNIYLRAYRELSHSFPDDMSRVFDPSLSEARREELLSCIDPEMASKYAWAVPSDRAINIINNFSPVVEIACGQGYWGSLITASGAEYTGFDQYVAEAVRNGQMSTWHPVKDGGPQVLKGKRYKNHTLLLCYPDDFEHSDESVAEKCLQFFQGDHIILVGELLGETINGDNPWGKSVSGDFQMNLAHQFHMVLQIPLPSWPGSRDSLSVWKRTKKVQVDDDYEMHHIPREEQISLTRSAAAYHHLLDL